MEIKIIGEEIWYGAYRLGARPIGMPATQWDGATYLMTPEMSPEEIEKALSDEYDRGRSDAREECRGEMDARGYELGYADGRKATQESAVRAKSRLKSASTFCANVDHTSAGCAPLPPLNSARNRCA